MTDDSYAYRFTHAEILRVLSGVLLCIFLAAIDQTVVIPAVPAIAADLHGFGHLAWIVSAYLLTATAATPIYGKLSDIYGRRQLLLFGLAVFAVASALCALSQTVGELIAARAIQGIGGAGLMSMAQASIADVVSPRERGRYQGYMASAWGVASIAGPIIGGWVTDAISWRWIFWINLPIALVGMALCNRALRLLIVRPHGRVRIDFLGAALLTGGVTCWLVVLSWGGVGASWTSPPIVELFALGSAMFAALARHERRVADPLLPPRMFANPVVVRGVMLAFFAALAMFGGTFLLPLFFQLVGGADASRSGELVVPFLGANCLGAYAAGLLARRAGKVRAILLAGLGACAVGFLLLATMGPASPLWLTVGAQAVVGFGLGLTMPSTLVIVQNAALRRDVGVVTGMLLFLRSMGGAFGSTLVGAVLALRFRSRLDALGITSHLDLGALRGGGDALAGMDQATRRLVQGGLTDAFHWAFMSCAVSLLLALAIAWRTRDLPLRSGTDPVEEAAAAPGALAH